jgi:hypothetical protein
MEKMGVVRPDITPDVETAKTADCADAVIVDNKERKIEALDADFRKQAAELASRRLNS